MLDDELEPGTLASVEAHLRECATCADELRRLRSTIALLHAVQRARAPAGFVERVIAAAHPVPRWRRTLRRLVFPLPVKLPMHAAAAVLLAVGVGYLLQRTPELRDAARVNAPVFRENDVAPPSPAAPAVGSVGSRQEPDAELRQPAPSDVPPAASRPPQPAAPGAAPPTPTRASRFEQAPAQAIEQAQAPREQRARRSDDAELTDEAERGGPAIGRPLAKSASPSVTAREAPAATAEGELGVASRDGARRALQELAARHGARVVAGRPTDAVEMIGVHVPRDQYDSFVRGLAALGRWRSTRDPGASAGVVEMTIRLVE
jgi:hypothetical protein